MDPAPSVLKDLKTVAMFLAVILLGAGIWAGIWYCIIGLLE